MFDCYTVSLELIRALRDPIARIATKDASLAQQLRKAAASIPLNVAEGRRRTGKDRHHHWRIASGSAEEVRACLDVASAWGYIEDDAATAALELLDRVLAMLYKMTN
jgi:four helix bundle protein